MDLQTDYLGIKLKNPLLISSCSLSEKIENIKLMEQAGAAAIVMSPTQPTTRAVCESRGWDP
jgi:dihydroorotate dehydrogenase (fumarate)